MKILLPAGSLMLALCTPALAATAVPAAAPSAPPAGPGRSAFLARSALGDVQLAPDGTALAYLSRSGSAQSLSLLMTAGGKTRILLPETDARRIFWSANARWLFVQSRNLLSAIDITGSATPVPVMALGPQGPAVLGASPTGAGAAILMERVGEKYRLVAIVPGGPGETIYEGPREPLDTAFDPAGRLAWVKFAAGDRHSIERVRADGSLARVAECVRLETCSFVGTADRGRSLLMRSDMGGDLQALVTLGESGAIVRTALDPARAADLRDVVIDPQTQVPLVAAYRSAGARNVGLTADGRRAVAAIERSLGHANFQLVAAHGETGRWLVVDRGDRAQFPSFSLFDPRTRRLTPILDSYSANRIPRAMLADRRPLAFRASDGIVVRGFLTLPAGADPKRTPLVVEVHGGPWSNVEPGFGAVTQLLASRGYAVWEPNFRSSTGYGRAYRFVAGGDLADGRAQADIVETTRALLRRHIGDPGRVAIIGISYGGHAALLAATLAPELFRTALAVSPPTDLSQSMRIDPGQPDPVSDGIALSTRLRLYGLTAPEAAARLHAESPLAYAAKLRRPVTIIAGAQDKIVPLAGVKAYADRLAALGKPVTLVVDPDGGHGPTTPVGQQAFLYLLEESLHRALGGPAPAPPEAAVARLLAAPAQAEARR